MVTLVGIAGSTLVHTYLKPVNCAAVYKCWKLPESVSEGIPNRTHTQHNVKVLFTAIHKEVK